MMYFVPCDDERDRQNRYFLPFAALNPPVVSKQANNKLTKKTLSKVPPLRYNLLIRVTREVRCTRPVCLQP